MSTLNFKSYEFSIFEETKKRTDETKAESTWSKWATSNTDIHGCAQGCLEVAPASHSGLNCAFCTAGRTWCSYMHSEVLSVSVLDLQYVYGICTTRVSIVLNEGLKSLTIKEVR